MNTNQTVGARLDRARSSRGRAQGAPLQRSDSIQTNPITISVD
jgi:hypothetical protein